MIGANETISTYRLANAAGADKTTSYSVSKTLDGVSVYIESARPELAIVIQSKPGMQNFMMYMEPADIIQGDKVVTSGGKTYFVQAVGKFEDNTDTDDLYEVILGKEVTRYYD